MSMISQKNGYKFSFGKSETPSFVSIELPASGISQLQQLHRVFNTKQIRGKQRSISEPSSNLQLQINNRKLCKPSKYDQHPSKASHRLPQQNKQSKRSTHQKTVPIHRIKHKSDKYGSSCSSNEPHYEDPHEQLPLGLETNDYNFIDTHMNSRLMSLNKMRKQETSFKGVGSKKQLYLRMCTEKQKIVNRAQFGRRQLKSLTCKVVDSPQSVRSIRNLGVPLKYDVSSLQCARSKIDHEIVKTRKLLKRKQLTRQSRLQGTASETKLPHASNTYRIRSVNDPISPQTTQIIDKLKQISYNTDKQRIKQVGFRRNPQRAQINQYSVMISQKLQNIRSTINLLKQETE